MRLDRITHGADPSRSLRNLALDMAPHVRLRDRGVLDSGYGNAPLALDTGNARVAKLESRNAAKQTILLS